jgi:uncharacterized protein (TIGR02391 family)
MSTQPTRAQLILFQEIYGVFARDGSWPIHQYLDAQLDQKHGLVLDDVLASLPEGLLRVYQPVRDDTEIMLRIAGMLYCDGTDGDVSLFVRGLRWCVAKQAAFQPKSATASEQLNVSTHEVIEEWAQGGIDATEMDLDKLHRMFESEWIGVSRSGMPGTWRWTIPKDIRRFRPVGNVYDYLRVIADDKPHLIPANPLVHQAPNVLSPRAQPVEVVDSGNGERQLPTLTVDSLHPLVRDACAELFAGKHYRQGVLDAALGLRDLVRDKSGISETNDSTLMGKALGGKDPAIVVSQAPGDQGKNMQQGTTYLALGVAARVRNVLAHEKLELDPGQAMEMVAVISRVVRDIEGGSAAARDD